MNEMKLTKAEKRKLLEAEGSHFKLHGKFVIVTKTFYPKTREWIEDCSGHSEHEHTNRRPLTDATKAQLEDWL